eukprot:6447185-Alexandrium_andersonii.AAC.1
MEVGGEAPAPPPAPPPPADMAVDAPTQPYVAPVGLVPPEEASGEAVRRRNGRTSRAGPYEAAGAPVLPAGQHPLDGGL